MASNIKPKESANLLECVRLSYNSRYWASLSKGYNGYRYLDRKMEADSLLDTWLKKNLDGLPEENTGDDIK